jgi:hypothetical protein
VVPGAGKSMKTPHDNDTCCLVGVLEGFRRLRGDSEDIVRMGKATRDQQDEVSLEGEMCICDAGRIG